MVIAPLIERKRDGGALAPEEWRSLIQAFALGEVPDYQVSALAMAVMFRGLEPPELSALTDAMIDSGDRLRWDGFTVPRIDKHSTGGVGDKTSLLLVPLVAAVGAAVPMMSGRSLGHTGGTLDKLEAIAGFRTGISLREAEAQVRRIGCVMLRQVMSRPCAQSTWSRGAQFVDICMMPKAPLITSLTGWNVASDPYGKPR